MYHLPMKPAVGGKPPSDSRNTVISAASAGSRVPQPGEVAQFVVLVRSRLASSAITPNAPRLVTA